MTFTHISPQPTPQEWAAALLADPADWLILDTETTGLDSESEVVQIGVVAPDRTVLFDQYVRPTKPIPAGATAIHGITNEMVAGAPTYAEVYPELAVVLSGKIVVCYNAVYDSRLLQQSGEPYCRTTLPALGWDCAMERYAAFVGRWSSRHRSYTYQPLPRDHDGPHTAVGDCLATLDVIERMARG